MTTRSNLSELESLGLIHLAMASEEAAYLFRHALIQDAAYASLVKQDRQHLNLLVGETLERLYADRVEQIAPRLANHFDSAGVDRRALKYFTLAGDRAARQFANIETVVDWRPFDYFTVTQDVTDALMTITSQLVPIEGGGTRLIIANQMKIKKPVPKFLIKTIANYQARRLKIKEAYLKLNQLILEDETRASLVR
jgi:hypothetical protein